MRGGETIKSDLDIWINKINTKKFHYDGCPHCKKSAESKANCPHCHKFVDKIIPHFILGIEISDFYGSIWTTAHDEFGVKIFEGE
jgi:hypothetical protein